LQNYLYFESVSEDSPYIYVTSKYFYSPIVFVNSSEIERGRKKNVILYCSNKYHFDALYKEIISSIIFWKNKFEKLFTRQSFIVLCFLWILNQKKLIKKRTKSVIQLSRNFKKWFLLWFENCMGNEYIGNFWDVCEILTQNDSAITFLFVLILGRSRSMGPYFLVVTVKWINLELWICLKLEFSYDKLSKQQRTRRMWN